MMAQGEQPPTAALPPGFFGGEPQWRELARAAARIDQHLASQGLGPALERELSQLTENLCRLLSAEDERRKLRREFVARQKGLAPRDIALEITHDVPQDIAV